MHCDGGGACQGGLTSVLASVGPGEVIDGKGAAVTVLGDPVWLVRVIVDHAAVVIPEDVHGLLSGALHDAV